MHKDIAVYVSQHKTGEVHLLTFKNVHSVSFGEKSVTEIICTVGF